jgi:hypothetical protein
MTRCLAILSRFARNSSVTAQQQFQSFFGGWSDFPVPLETASVASRPGGAMSVREVIAGTKTVISLGNWSTGSKMPKTAFPLEKSRSFKVSTKYRWRVVSFMYAAQAFRVLIYYRLDIEKYVALLGMEVGGDMLCLARYEYHATERGWHLHTDCGHAPMISGRHGGFSTRLPSPGAHHRRAEFDVHDDETAWKKAVDIFGLAERPSSFALTPSHGH